MPIVTNIIEQHLDDASFKWLIRNSAIDESHYNLKDLAELDGLVNAHIDGLQTAGNDGWKICCNAMSMGEPGEVFTAGVLAYETLIPERMDAVLTAAESDATLQLAVISALGWIDFDTIRESIRNMLTAQAPYLRYIGLAAHAVHRQDPCEALKGLLNDPDATVRARAFKAVGELGRRDLLAQITPILHRR